MGQKKASKPKPIKTIMKEYKLFFLGLSIGMMFIVGFVVGITASMDTSIVNQLQHYTQTVRTNDMFNPIIVYDDAGFLEIEITLPHLTEIVDTDGADLLVSYWMCPNPLTSVYDWYYHGIFIDDFLIYGAELDSYCDNPDATDTYYTHFYRLWHVDDLVPGYTYAIYCDFYDADDTFWQCAFPWLGGGEDIPMSVNVIDLPPELPSEEDLQDALLDCSLISFFEYQLSQQTDSTPPGETGSSDGAEADGWMNQYTIFSNLQNWVVILIFLLILSIIGLMIFILFYFAKDKKKKKKSSKKKK